MATRSIDTNIWNDPKMTDDFTPEDRYFWLYCLTNKHSNLSGVFEVSYKQISDEMGYNIETIKNLIYRFTIIHSVITYVEETNEMFVHNWYKYNWTKSPKFEVALNKYVLKIKDDDIREFVLFLYQEFKEGNRVSIPYRYGSNTISNTDTNLFNLDTKNKEEPKTKDKRIHIHEKKFIPPTLNEIIAYCKLRNSKVDPKAFFDFFEAGDWKDSNGKQVKNWKQKLITWESHSGSEVKHGANKSEETTNSYIPRRKREGA